MAASRGWVPRSEGRLAKSGERVSKSDGREWIGANNGRDAWVEQQVKELERRVRTSGQGGEGPGCLWDSGRSDPTPAKLPSLVTKRNDREVAENEKESEENRVAQYTLL